MRSDNRTGILTALCGEGPLDRYELEARVDASRRTITRIVDALSERGYLAERDDGYVATAFGSALAVGIDGRPRALVESTDPEFLSWIEDRLDGFQHEAVPVGD